MASRIKVDIVCTDFIHGALRSPQQYLVPSKRLFEQMSDKEQAKEWVRRVHWHLELIYLIAFSWSTGFGWTMTSGNAFKNRCNFFCWWSLCKWVNRRNQWTSGVMSEWSSTYHAVCGLDLWMNYEHHRLNAIAYLSLRSAYHFALRMPPRWNSCRVYCPIPPMSHTLDILTLDVLPKISSIDLPGLCTSKY